MTRPPVRSHPARLVPVAPAGAASPGQQVCTEPSRPVGRKADGQRGRRRVRARPVSPGARVEATALKPRAGSSQAPQFADTDPHHRGQKSSIPGRAAGPRVGANVGGP